MRFHIIYDNILNLLLIFIFNIKTTSLRTTENTSVLGDESKNLSKEISEEDLQDGPYNFEDDNAKEVTSERNKNCWMTLNAKQHFQIMDNLDERYRKVRRDYQEQLGEEFDKNMLNTLLKWRGVAQRDTFRTNGKINLIPSGLNLGGYCMMKMKDSVLFFHRMKLRNQTHFRINYLNTDVENMVLVMRLSLHDLHLLGAYERSPVDKDPSILYYAPTFGEVEFLLKNVDYKMEAQLRLLNGRLFIELVTSKLNIEDILMMYTNSPDYTKPIRLIKDNIEDFLERIKTDLDKWLKDYFNDYLTYYGPVKTPSSEFMEAEKGKVIALNEYADFSLNIIRNRIRSLGVDNVKIPHFTIYGINQMKLILKDGALWGLDSIYRRSVTTAKKENNIRKVNLIIGFSNFKVMYKYEASLEVDVPPLTGIIVLTANEISAHMEISLVKDPETVDFEFDFIQQMKPESLTVEGAASRMIANFKHLLEHHIIAIMSNAVTHSIKMLTTLSRCEPMLISQHKSNNVLSLSKINANDDILEEETDIDFQKIKYSHSDANNDGSNNVNTNESGSQYYIQNTPNSTSSGEIPVSGSDKSSSQNINNDSNNLVQGEEDISENSYSPKKSEEMSSTNTSQLIKDLSYSQGDEVFESGNSPYESDEIGPANRSRLSDDINNNEHNDELSSELENQDSESELLNENSNETSSNEDNFTNTKHPKIDDGFTLTKNDSVEFELSGTDNFKGGKFKLTREEKMKLIKE